MALFHIRNFGCRATQADGAALGSMLAHQGLEHVDDAAAAELVILNTCTVTADADNDVRQAIRKINRANPAARILVTGCYAQRSPDELAAMPGVEWVVGNSHKVQIPKILANRGLEFHGEIHLGDVGAQTEFLSAPIEDAGDRTRPNLKIQDGCNNVCSFCIIPSVRGRSRSAHADSVVAQVGSLAERFREVVLSGINLGRWGRDLGSLRLVGLLRRLLDETPIERLRLSSIEPMDWSEELLDLVASSSRIAKHVHAPLQSGCDSVLKRMKRRYRSRHYASRLLLARQWMPDAGIGADVMVGFPGETDAEFEESRAFIERMPFTYLHVFTYSERPGTAAANHPSAVPMQVRRQRNRILSDLATAKNLAFRHTFLGRSLSVVTLQSGMFGLSENYLKVELASKRPANQLLDVEIDGVSGEALRERELFHQTNSSGFEQPLVQLR